MFVDAVRKDIAVAEVMQQIFGVGSTRFIKDDFQTSTLTLTPANPNINPNTNHSP